MFSRSHCFSHRLIFFWSAVFKTSHSASAGALPRLRDMAGFMCPATTVLVLFCLFHKSMTSLPVFSSWSAGTPLLEAFPRALSSSAEHIMRSCSPRFWLKRGTLCTWSWLNRTLCIFQAISLIVEIILNSVLACRIRAIPCSFSLHQ